MKNVAWKLDEPFNGISERISAKLDAHVTVEMIQPMNPVYDVHEAMIIFMDKSGNSLSSFFAEKFGEIERFRKS